MLSGDRRHHSPQFKRQVVLELLKGQKSAAQLAREHNSGRDLPPRWQGHSQERAAQGFRGGRGEARGDAARLAELGRLAGQRALELTSLKRGGASGAASRSGGR